MKLINLFNLRGQREISNELNRYLTKELALEYIDNEDDLVLFFNKSENWIGANHAFLNMFGFENINDFRKNYNSIRELFYYEEEKIPVDLDKDWLEYIKNEKNGDYKVRILTEKKDMFTFSVKIIDSNIYDDLYIVKLKDITDVVKAAQKEEEYENLKSKFLANISHEFRTPMNGILGFVELFYQTELTPKQLEYLQMLNRSARSLMANIENLLDLSQLQSKKLKIRNTYFNLSDSLEKIIKNYSAQAVEANKNFYSFIDPRIPKEVYIDPRKIKQIINALLQNALKFTDKGGKIYFDARVLKKIDDKVEIVFRIKDTGIGISKEEIESILKPFSSGQQADQKMGIGLTLANAFINMLDSKLDIKSEVGQGSTFSFKLNIKTNNRNQYMLPFRKTAKVVLLDKDRLDDANYIYMYLKSFGFEVLKSTKIDDFTSYNADSIYIVSNLENKKLLEGIKKLDKNKTKVLVAKRDEKPHANILTYIDDIVKEPLIPSTLYEHLLRVNKVEMKKVAKKREKLSSDIKALVVEDNIINQKLIKIILEDKGLNVDMASDGEEGVYKAMEKKYDIIFMDIDMPKKDGIVATNEIKKLSPINAKTPIVALTAMAMDGDREKLIEAGLDDYMSKPLKRDRLNYILEKML